MKDMLIDLCGSLPRTRTQLALVPPVTAVLNLVLTISMHVCKLLLCMFVSIHLFSVFKTKSPSGYLFTSIHSSFFAFNSRTPER